MFDAIASILRPLPFPKYRILNRLFPRSGTRRARIFGAWMQLDLQDLIQRRIYIGSYERQETRLIRSRLRPGATMIDVGANVGYFTALGALAVGPSGRVVAVEPNPRAFGRLAEMVQSTPLPQCSIHQFGLSDRANVLTLHQEPDRNNNLNSSLADIVGGTEYQVRVRTLDECMDEWKIDRVDVMKIDVEGHEPKVFAGAVETLRRKKIRALVCEFNTYWLQAQGGSAEGLWELLISAGFRTESGELRTPRFSLGTVSTYLMQLCQ
jgi:FkbM family methyltransferase